MAFTGRIKQLVQKYGRVAIGVHLSVSCASITGLYVAINNNVDVDALFRRVGISPGLGGEPASAPAPAPAGGDEVLRDAAAPPGFGEAMRDGPPEPDRPRNRTTELVASSGGALALALICNKALLPVRVPITIALTPPIARALNRWKLVKS